MIPEETDNLEIIHWPDERLKMAGERIEVFDDKLKSLAEQMIEIMFEANGVGLAAPQLGLGLQLFVGRAPGQVDQPQVYVNPELFDLGGTVSSEEGCLSVPGITVKIKRVAKMGIRAQDLQGKVFEQEADQLLGRMWQHEFDHCSGMVIIDRMSRLQQIAHRRAMRELEESHKHPKT